MTQVTENFLQQDEHIGVYAIKDVISKNKSSITYRAWNQHLNAIVALKEYFPDDCAMRHQDGKTLGPTSADMQKTFASGLQAFIQRAESLAEIQHPNIVSVHNVLPFNGTAYLALDYENGDPLRKHCLAPNSCNETELRIIFLTMLEALQHMHEQDITHGNIHPDNILIRKNGQPVLIDATLTHAPQQLQTGYAPAEQYAPDYRPNPATDLYALAATMYHCISQTLPCSALDRITAISKHEADPLQPITELADASYNENMLNCIDNMLAPQAKDRPQSARDVLNKLVNDPQPPSAEIPAPYEQQVSTANTATHARGLISGILGTIALISIALWYFQHNQQQPETAPAGINKQSASASSNKDNTRHTATSSLTDQRKPILPAQSESSVATKPPLPAAHQTSRAETVADLENKELTNVSTVTEMPTAQQQATKTQVYAENIPVTKTAPDLVSTPKSDALQTAQIPTAVDATAPTKEPTSSLLDPKKVTAINQHLTSAAADMAAFRLTTPAENNAYLNYQAVLSIDPQNEQARAGLQNIVDLYIREIEKALQENHPSWAKVYLHRAEAVLPGSPDLQKIRKALIIDD